MAQTESRPFRWFRVKYSPQYVDSSVGHVCMFGEKKDLALPALIGADGPVPFSKVYAQVSHVAYSLRHLTVAPRLAAFLDCEEEHAALVGLLGALRGGLSVTVPDQLMPLAARDATIASQGCEVVLSARPETLEGSEAVVIPLDTLPQLALPKELDWYLPRPRPDDVALRVPSQTSGEWRDLLHAELVDILLDQHSAAIERFPLQAALSRFARAEPVTPAQQGGNRQPPRHAQQ